MPRGAGSSGEPSTQVAREAEPRELTDPVVMRALAHPLRMALLELLLREGPLTASQAASLLDDSPGNMSWHLQTLAKYGFVEEAGGGRGRARPWRLVAAGNRFSAVAGDSELSHAASELERMFHERSLARLREWLSSQQDFPIEWQHAAFASDNISYLTPDELEDLGAQMTALLMRFRDRTLDRAQRPAGARPVHVVAFGHPLPFTPGGN